ncbi:MAG: helix-turn-helix domain-containing protein [Proteiniphilum sp.]|nr:helix-turn-helix domain-containing protein [Proteiniphilum sp.]MDD4158091.1 helix-turn-helix domain-containing protein [Proteiniphilum sp.]
MNQAISLFDWRSEMNVQNTDAIGENLILLENPQIHLSFDYPFKVDITIVVICTKGTMKGSVNLKNFTMRAPALLVVLPQQILKLFALSKEFTGYYILISHQSIESITAMYIRDFYTLRNAVKEQPWSPLDAENLERMLSFFTSIQQIIRTKDHIHRIKIAELLAQAMYLEMENVFSKSLKHEKKSKRVILAERFLELVEHHYPLHRDTKFYADKLSLSSKYLSKIIKENTGKSAIDWINSYVLLDAKALLKSTNQTIQQISDQLNFPSQSHFGKFFKNHTGVSPKEYRSK